MPSRICDKQAQLHPLQRALKESWRKLVVLREVKQLFLATRCKVDESRISRWLNPSEPDFPPTPQMAQLVEALQEWPGIEPWEPLEAWNAYFGCHTTAIRQSHEPLQALLGLLALDEGKLMDAALNGEHDALAHVLHHLRRVVDTADDEVSGDSAEAVVGGDL